MVPFDQETGLTRYPSRMSVELMLRCAWWAQQADTWQDAEDMLLATAGVSVNDDTLRQVTAGIGKLVYEEDLRKADRLLGSLPLQPQTAPVPGSICWILLSGREIRMRTEDGSGTCRLENRRAAVFSSGGIDIFQDRDGTLRRRVRRREFVSCFEPLEIFEKLLLACATRMGLAGAASTVVLTDGSPWVPDLVRGLFPGACLILDPAALRQRVCEWTGNLPPSGSGRYSTWADSLLQKIDSGRWEEALASFGELEDTGADGSLLQFLQENRSMLLYPVFRQQGFLPDFQELGIRNRDIFLSRTSRVRWTPDSAQYLATLQAKQDSGLWETDVVRFIHELYEGPGWRLRP